MTEPQQILNLVDNKNQLIENGKNENQKTNSRPPENKKPGRVWAMAWRSAEDVARVSASASLARVAFAVSSQAGGGVWGCWGVLWVLWVLGVLNLFNEGDGGAWVFMLLKISFDRGDRTQTRTRKKVRAMASGF